MRIALRFPHVLLACAAVLAVGCSKETPSTQPAAAPAGREPERPGRTGTASVSGRALYSGALLKPQHVHMSADPYCAKVNEFTTPQPPIGVGADGGLAEVFVYVAKGLENERFAAPAEPVILDQQKCAYVPRVIGLQVGQPLEVRNSDETLHNVHALSEKGDGFNVGMPHKGMSAVRKFSVPEALVRIKCDVHPWMTAFAGVVANPFHAVTGEDGGYRLQALAPGEYTIRAVHFELGELSKNVTVTDGAEVKADFTFAQ